VRKVSYPKAAKFKKQDTTNSNFRQITNNWKYTPNIGWEVVMRQDRWGKMRHGNSGQEFRDKHYMSARYS
jgi:hypothetical protein